MPLWPCTVCVVAPSHVHAHGCVQIVIDPGLVYLVYVATRDHDGNVLTFGVTTKEFFDRYCREWLLDDADRYVRAVTGASAADGHRGNPHPQSFDELVESLVRQILLVDRQDAVCDLDG